MNSQCRRHIPNPLNCTFLFWYSIHQLCFPFKLETKQRITFVFFPKQLFGPFKLNFKDEMCEKRKRAPPKTHKIVLFYINDFGYQIDANKAAISYFMTVNKPTRNWAKLICIVTC